MWCNRQASRQAAVAQAEAIIDAGVQSFMHWMDQRDPQHGVVPLIRQINGQADAWRAIEIARARKRLARGEDLDAVLDASRAAWPARCCTAPWPNCATPTPPRASRPRTRPRACSCVLKAKNRFSAHLPCASATFFSSTHLCMKPFLRNQLERYARRLQELDFLLSREDIMADMAQYRVLSREHAEVTQIAGRYTRWLQREADLAGAREMLQDADMAEMARDEITSCEAELQQLEDELQRLLLPKDPDDARNAFLEIRAGTGGDESAPVCGRPGRMYTRYAANVGWKVEVVSESPAELGYKGNRAAHRRRRRSMAGCVLNRAATACSACRSPKRRAASTPAPAPWP